jgi:hypothetical protein
MEENFNDGRLLINQIIVDDVSPRTNQQDAFLSYVSENSISVQKLSVDLGLKSLILRFFPEENRDNTIKIALNFNKKTLSEEERLDIKAKVDQLTSGIIENLQKKLLEIEAPKERTEEIAALKFEINYGTSFDVNIESIERATLKPSRRFYK